METPNTFTPQEVLDAIEGRFVQVVKSIRERTGLGLKEAKDQGDRLRLHLGLLAAGPCTHCQGSGAILTPLHATLADKYRADRANNWPQGLPTYHHMWCDSRGGGNLPCNCGKV